MTSPPALLMLGQGFTHTKAEEKDFDLSNAFKDVENHSAISAARCKKPHSIGEELVLPAAIEIVETMFGDNFSKQLQSIPLSNDTVARRIGDIAKDVQCQLFSKLRDKLFSIQFDEATDSYKDAHLIAYVRFCDNMSVAEELLSANQ
nr:protein FAM200A-like [Parasteatoda tepidariorum]